MECVSHLIRKSFYEAVVIVESEFKDDYNLTMTKKYYYELKNHHCVHFKIAVEKVMTFYQQN